MVVVRNSPLTARQPFKIGPSRRGRWHGSVSGVRGALAGLAVLLGSGVGRPVFVLASPLPPPVAGGPAPPEHPANGRRRQSMWGQACADVAGRARRRHQHRLRPVAERLWLLRRLLTRLLLWLCRRRPE